jgi:hypothetical protein
MGAGLMASGGARARSGPAPQANAIRNGRAGADWIRLPASGRKGEPPPWPLTRGTGREKALWADEWKRPQAIMWQANGQELEVALYVRAIRIAENPKAKAGDRTLVVRLQEHLGLSQPGLARNRWMIVDDVAMAESAPADTGGGAQRPIPISDARDRLRRLGSDAG